jgi:hypothetical protein
MHHSVKKTGMGTLAENYSTQYSTTTRLVVWGAVTVPVAEYWMASLCTLHDSPSISVTRSCADRY